MITAIIVYFLLAKSFIICLPVVDELYDTAEYAIAMQDPEQADFEYNRPQYDYESDFDANTQSLIILDDSDSDGNSKQILTSVSQKDLIDLLNGLVIEKPDDENERTSRPSQFQAANLPAEVTEFVFSGQATVNSNQTKASVSYISKNLTSTSMNEKSTLLSNQTATTPTQDVTIASINKSIETNTSRATYLSNGNQTNTTSTYATVTSNSTQFFNQDNKNRTNMRFMFISTAFNANATSHNSTKPYSLALPTTSQDDVFNMSAQLLIQNDDTVNFSDKLNKSPNFVNDTIQKPNRKPNIINDLLDFNDPLIIKKRIHEDKINHINGSEKGE
jgi:hypothetical protein